MNTAPLGPAALTASFLANASAACPIPLLQTVLRLASLGLEVVSDVRTGSEAGRQLARHTAAIALAVSAAVDEHEEALSAHVLRALETLQIAVDAIYQALNKAKNAGRLVRMLQRDRISTEIKGLRKDLDAAVQIFQVAMAIQTSRFLHRVVVNVEVSNNRVLDALDDIVDVASVPDSRWISLPPPPPIFFGRDIELDGLVGLISVHAQDGAAVAVLGTGGVGKTSLTLAALHHPHIVTFYGTRRLFVSCEGSIDHAVLHTLASAPAVIPEASRVAVEGLLAALAAVPSLTLLITMRGSERPHGTRWTAPRPLILQPFSRDAALQAIFKTNHNISETELHSLDSLLDALGDLPLAVSIISALLIHESADELFTRWKTERTTMLTLGEQDKMSSLDVSIQVSLLSNRMKTLPQTEALLSTLSLFPDGVAETENGLHFLQAYLPRLRQHVSVLMQASLAYTNSKGRICVLPPVREFMLRHREIPPIFVSGLAAYCRSFSGPLLETEGSAVVHDALLPEFQNLHSIMNFLISSAHNEALQVLDLVPPFDRYSVERGYKNERMLLSALALAQTAQRIDVQADILVRIAKVSHGQIAATYAMQALDLATKTGQHLQQAEAHISFAKVLMAQLQSAFDILDKEGQSSASTLVSFANLWSIYGDQAERVAATRYMYRARKIQQQLRNEAGVIKCDSILARRALERCQYTSSELAARRSLDFALKSQDVIQEAEALRVISIAALHLASMERLGKIYLQIGLIPAAIWSIKTQAQTAFEKLHEAGLASSLNALQCYKARGALRAKEMSFVSARQDFATAMSMARTVAQANVGEEAFCLYEEARMHNMLGETSAAALRLIIAIVVFRKTGDLSALLDCLFELARTFKTEGEITAAWNCWSAALDIHLRSGAAYDAGICLLAMAEVQLQHVTEMPSSPTGSHDDFSPSGRLGTAYSLFKANNCAIGIRKCVEMVRNHGLPDPSLNDDGL
ncbi:hypothetical protein BKA62DRAFT_681874 [Auriculariales sp. MPI-PUGE-AT-0066]|nr:hypothetical protein BKA62DRAFT_681874 [Auriculariales sp. MPI-PUGE-AT-0066]